MSVKKTALFRLSQSAKRLIAITPEAKRTAVKNMWVEAEANAAFKPRTARREFNDGAAEQ